MFSIIVQMSPWSHNNFSYQFCLSSFEGDMVAFVMNSQKKSIDYSNASVCAGIPE